MGLYLWGASVAVIAMTSGQSAAQDCTGTQQDPCNIAVTSDDQAVTVTGPAIIANQADGTSVTQTVSAPIVLTNASGATTDFVVFAPFSPFGVPFSPDTIYLPLAGNTVINSGTIAANLLFTNGGTYINDGGVLTGNFGPANPSAFTTEVLIDRSGNYASGGILGAVDGGNGIDIYAISRAQSATVTPVAPLPLNFEIFGIETRGAGTVVTLAPPAIGAINGLALFGNGGFVNAATIDDWTLAGTNFPAQYDPPLRAIHYLGTPGASGNVLVPWFTPSGSGYLQLPMGSALASFVNQGTVNGDVLVATASFTNSGTMNLRSSQAGTIVLGAANQAFGFVNSGAIVMSDTGARPYADLIASAISLASALDTTTIAPVSLLNTASGVISGGLAGNFLASSFTFTNDGVIGIGDNGNVPDRAVDIEVGEFELAMDPAMRENVVATTVTVVNNGTFDGGISFDATGRNASFTNTGLINRDGTDEYASAINIEIGDYGANQELDAAAFTFANSGTVFGSTELVLAASLVTVSNSGSMTQERHDLIGSFDVFPPAFSALLIEQNSTLSGEVSVSNSGTIESSDSAGFALAVVMEAGDVSSGVAGAADANAVASVTNSGLIHSDGGAYIVFGPNYGYPQCSLVIRGSGAIGAVLDGEGGSSLHVVNAAGGEIVGGPAPTLLLNPNTGVSQVASAPASSAIVALASEVTIDNAGTIAGAAGGVADPTWIFAYGDVILDASDIEGVVGGAIDTYFSVDLIENSGLIDGGIALRQGNDRLLNTGTITGNVHMGTGSDIVNNAGAMSGAITLGDGNDSFVVLLADIASHLATIDGGNGVDSFIWNVSAGGSLQDLVTTGATGFEYFAIAGTGTVTSDGGAAMAPIQIATGDITLAAGSTLAASGEFALLGGSALTQSVTNRGTIAGSVDLGVQDDFFRNYGTLDGNLVLGDGNDTFVQGINAVFTGTADGGNGTDRFVLDINGGGTIDQSIYDRLISFETLVIEGTGTIITDGTEPLPVETIELTGTDPVEFAAGSVIQTLGDTAITGSDAGETLVSAAIIIGDVDLGDGDNSFGNTGAVEGSVVTGTGDDAIANDGSISGDLATGAGDDAVINEGSIGGDLYLDGDAGGATTLAAGTMRVALAADIVAAEVLPVPTGGDDVLESSGEIAGSVFAGGGNDSFTLTGSVGGDIDMGTGDDSLILSGGWSIGGSAIGGDGSDRLAMTFAGTEATPTVLDLSRFTSFETFASQGGVAAYEGTASFAAVEVAGGRLIGKSGSILDADVAVAADAIFGSAGTVNGDVTVAGTLSPGASPATMTVNGNVTLGASSTTVFEFTPAVSDALIIDGSLDIVAGASLELTGNRPFTPGNYTLISATDGITGTFGDNVTQASTVFGFLTYSATSIDLVATFQPGATATDQTVLTVDYLNDLLLAGSTPAGVLAAYAQLIDDDGYADDAAFATLSPEAYASAAQMGIENGLAISRALRNASMLTDSEDGALFVFAKGFGAWRDFDGGDNGVSSADTSTSGLVGGIGFGNAGYAASAFVGYSDSKQTIDAIDAQTKADGLFFGAKFEASAGGLEAGASLVFDRSTADTVRAPLGVAANSRYRLRGTTLDGYVGYAATLGNWAVGPRVGLTHLVVKRGAALETGGGAFALDVAADKAKATYLTGDLRASTATAGLDAWIEGGIRHVVDSKNAFARAGFTGTDDTYGVPGIGRDKTNAHVGAGASIALTPMLSLQLEGDFEFAGDSNARSIGGGVRLQF